ncbi:hypothetical protein XENOCAPTIV_001793 [Xenoophorus captivus]|uniref:Uncharacterized protein n=1 Tax=Xenoophorus captivus TaxID=1517983 RepID=A0ABV0RD94_9TELE
MYLQIIDCCISRSCHYGGILASCGSVNFGHFNFDLVCQKDEALIFTKLHLASFSQASKRHLCSSRPSTFKPHMPLFHWLILAGVAPHHVLPGTGCLHKPTDG